MEATVTQIEDRAEKADPDSDREAAEALGGKPSEEAESGAKEPEADLEGEGADEQPKIFELELEGDRKALNGSMGGRKPDTASVKLRGGSAIVPEGQYDKGDVVNLLIKVRCTEIHGVDKMDNQTGDIVATERRHIFKVQGVEKVGNAD